MPVVNVGASANNGQGDPLRNAFIKINDEFDGTKKIYSSRAAMAAAVGAGDLANGQIAFVNNRRFQVDSRGPDLLLALDMDWSGRIEMQMARMVDGQTVSICPFGDSTTAGSGTSDQGGQNPVDANGEALGTGAYNPPNAWPTVFRGIIRAMYKNTNIQVWNAGYGGKALVDGWATRNFQRAVIENPDYGTPNICIINFGLNDMAREVFTLDTFWTELNYLLNLMDYFGVIPVLMTPDPVAQNTPRNPGNIQRLNQVYKRAADLYGIKLIDSHDALQTVFSGKSRNALWKYNQPDGLHFNNSGHRVKASFAACSLFTNTLWLDGKEDSVHVAPWSRQANTQDKSYFVFSQGEDGMNGKFGGTLTVTADSYATGDRLMEVWAWSSVDEYQAFYHSMDGDGYYYPRARATCPQIELAQYTFGSTTPLPSQSSGRQPGPGTYRASEEPMQLLNLAGGLTRLSFRAPTDHTANQVYLGFFSFRKIRWPVSYTQWIGAGSGTIIADPDAFDKDVTVLGGGYGKLAFAFIDMVVPNGAGFCIASGRVWGDVGYAVDLRRRGLAIVRNGATLEVRDIGFDSSGVLVNNLLATGAYTWSDTSNLFRVSLSVNSSDEHAIQITPVATPLAPVVTLLRPRDNVPFLFGGSPGAMIKNFNVSPQAGIAKMTIYGVNYANIA